MICTEDRKNVRKFLEDLLDEAEYQRVRRHMDACDACSQFMRAAGSVSSMLMEMGRIAGADDLVDNVLFRYEKLRRTVPRAAEPVPTAVSAAPAAFSQPVVIQTRSSAGVKVLIGLFVFLAAGLAWRDWVQTRLLENVLRAKSAPAAVPQVPAAPGPERQPAMRGDFEWGNARVHWPQGGREAVSALVRGFSPDIRYEAPGLLVVRIDAAQDAAWREALRHLPDATIEESPASVPEEGDRLYTIDYEES